MKTIRFSEIEMSVTLSDDRDEGVVRALVAACDDEGMLQAEQMRRLVDDPKAHTAMKIESALALFGTVTRECDEV